MSRACALVLALLIGCAAPTPTSDTGARASALSFAEALTRKDWATAYDCLAPETRQRWAQAEFTRRAGAYLRGLGFEPKAARVRSCEEQGGRAVAHVLFTAPRKQYRDGWELRRLGDGWRVILQANFGAR